MISSVDGIGTRGLDLHMVELRIYQLTVTPDSELLLLVVT